MIPFRDSGLKSGANNCEERSDSMLGVDKTAEDAMDLEVDVVGTDDGGEDPAAAAAATAECSSSSSFGNTFEGCNEEEEEEVEEAQMSGEDGCNGAFRTKRLTAHWRNFIRPLMWRCHWIELRMKELRSQALKYDKELAIYADEKQSRSEMVESEKTASRSIPLTCLSHTKQVMMRRKRKRKEEILDTSSYMSRHNIFSYYENTKPVSDGYTVEDACGDQDNNENNAPQDFWPNSECPVFGSKTADSFLEQILFTIESVQSRVDKLKTELNNVVSRNSGEIPSSHGNFIHGVPPPTVVPSSVCYSPGNIGEAMPFGALNASPHHISENGMEYPVMTESTVSSYGDAAQVDVLESTIGLLCKAGGHPDWQDIGDFHKDNADDVLINNQAAEEELQEFEISHGMEKPHEVIQEEVDSSFENESTGPTVSGYEVGLQSDEVDVPQQQHPALKPCYSGKRRGRKPKRKRRVASTVGSKKTDRQQKRKLA